MPKCKHCRRDTLTGTRSDGTPVLLDAVPLTYTYLETAYPTEGGRVSMSGALVVHDSVCPVLLRQQDAQRRANRARTAQRTEVA